MDKKQELSLLKEKITYIDTLLGDYNTENLRQWREETLMILDILIDQESKYFNNFENIRYSSAVITMGHYEDNLERHKEAYQSGLVEKGLI